MNRISGRIIRNNGKGIGGLVVVLYDVDLTNSEIATRFLTRGLQEEKSDRVDQYAVLLFAVLYGLQDSEEDPALRISQPGADRLGSIITNSNGAFSLNYDDAAFRIRDQEERPDLLVVVLAPDEGSNNFISGNIVIPLGKPEFERIVHLAVFPMRNAGREEQVLIRIPEATLNRFQLDQDQQLSPTSFVSLIAEAESRKKAVRTNLKDQLNLTQKVQKRRKLEREAETLVANLSAVPARLRARELFVGSGDNVSEAWRLTREQGVIERLGPHSNPLITAAHLRFSDNELRRIGLDNLDDFKVRLRNGEMLELPLDPGVVCAVLQEKIGGTELVKVENFLRDEKTRLEALRGEPDEEPGPTRAEEGGEVGEEEVLSAEEQIKQLVLAEVGAIDPEDEPNTEVSQVERIKRVLDTLKPPASPADVPAFHDVSHLQIAFPDVWSEAFNRDVIDLMKRLHIEYRDYDDSASGESTSIFGTDRINPGELYDVKDYTDLMGRLVGDIASAEERPIPPLVRELITEALQQSESGRPRVIVDGGGASTRGGRRRRTRDTDSIEDVQEVWNSLSIEQQETLIQLAIESPEVADESSYDSSRSKSLKSIWKRAIDLLESDDKTEQGLSILKDLDLLSEPGQTQPATGDKLGRVLEIISNPEGRVTRVQRLFTELAQRLSEPHSFRVFRKNSINFGIVTTYRQEWKPGPYQVADLVSTLPLAPGEMRKYSKRLTTKKSRAEKENEKYASTLSNERTLTSRAVYDIMEKANTATNFSQTAQFELGGKVLGFDVGLNTTSQFQRNQAVESQRVKKAFREAIRKASQEFRNEHSVEVSTESVSEFETTSMSEISNPNNEITVTYLFYELERQYTVSENLHRLTPVVLVAQEVPNPSDIDEDWLLTHEWILRRSLLDTSFHEALDYISEGLVGDEVELEVKREHYETQKALVEELAITVDSLSTLQETLRNSLVQTAEQEKLARVAQKRARRRRRRGRLRAAFGLGPPPGLSGRIASGAASLGFGSRNEDPAVLEARREALETRLEFLEGTLEDTRSQLTRASSVLENATQDLTMAAQESFTRRNLVSQLRIHVKDNILHYMQAIWSYEKPDQRFFRLYDLPIEVPVPDRDTSDSSGTFTFTPQPNFRTDGLFPNLLPPNSIDLLDVRMTMPAPGTTTLEVRRLHEIADLDNLLGYKGNYLIFPLKECTYITDFMMQDYVDDYFGIREPGPEGLANFTTDELLTYAESIWYAEETTDEMREALNVLIRQRLTSPRLEEELIVVPTGQLFIEALKGEHALLEHFKEQHRGLDVLKVHEEVQAERLENLRKAMRLVTEEPMLDDPEIDKRILVDRDSGVVVDTE